MEQKINKKIKAKRLMIENSEIVFSETPQNILAILNLGLSNSIKTDVLLEKFNEFARLQDIVLLPNKSYCFLKFESMLDAETVFKNFNGKIIDELSTAHLLMSFCEKIPHLVQDDHEQSPNGLLVLEDFITSDAENKLLSLLKGDKDDNKMKHRQVQHFGYEFLYGTNTVDYNKPLDEKIPIECNELWELLDERCAMFNGFRPDQLTVNRYEKGCGIPCHVDTHSVFEDPIISLSLGSSIVMEFKNPINGKHYSKLLKPRSLLIMSRESRYGWTHGIIPKMSDIVRSDKGFLTVQPRGLRYSFTFRKLKVPPNCNNCNHSILCDLTKDKKIQVNCEVDENIAAQLEVENVHNVYNEIGNHFSETRQKPWPNVENFINSLVDGSIMLDVGCGNGKYLGINDKILKFGCDRSETLLQVCVQRDFQVFHCDCLQIPLLDSCIDACISIAVIHHFATHERRLQSIKEMLRVLKNDGLLLIYVWAKDQQKDNKKTRYLLQHQSKNDNVTKIPEIATLNIDNNQIELPIHQNRTQFNHTNILVPWKLKQKELPEKEQKVFLRYYHVFEEGELEALCNECENAEIIKSYYDQGNHCVVLKKKIC